MNSTDKFIRDIFNVNGSGYRCSLFERANRSAVIICGKNSLKLPHTLEFDSVKHADEYLNKIPGTKAARLIILLDRLGALNNTNPILNI